MVQIAFRVDSSYQMGIGHLMRCLTLAEKLRMQGAEVYFVCRELPGNSIALLRELNFEVIPLSYDAEAAVSLYHLSEHSQWLGERWEQDAEQTMCCLANRKQKPDWLVVDHYALNELWEVGLRPYAQHLMVIDDLADRAHQCDILLDQNYYLNPSEVYLGLVPHACVQLVGPQYALLRPQFREQHVQVAARRGQVKRLLVFMGGNDTDNATSQVLHAITKLNVSSLNHIDVVVGRTNPHQASIRKFCEQNQGFHYHQHVANMAALMAQADLAIGCGGVATWERCCLGLPCILVTIAANQEVLVNNAISAGVFEYAGPMSRWQEEHFIQTFEKLATHADKLHAMSQNGLELVDGLGCERVAHEMLKKIGLSSNVDWIKC